MVENIDFPKACLWNMITNFLSLKILQIIKSKLFSSFLFSIGNLSCLKLKLVNFAKRMKKLTQMKWKLIKVWHIHTQNTFNICKFIHFFIMGKKFQLVLKFDDIKLNVPIKCHMTNDGIYQTVQCQNYYLKTIWKVCINKNMN